MGLFLEVNGNVEPVFYIPDLQSNLCLEAGQSCTHRKSASLSMLGARVHQWPGLAKTEAGSRHEDSVGSASLSLCHGKKMNKLLKKFTFQQGPQAAKCMVHLRSTALVHPDSEVTERKVRICFTCSDLTYSNGPT